MVDEAGFRLILLAGLYSLLSLERDVSRGQVKTVDLYDLTETFEVIHVWWLTMRSASDAALDPLEMADLDDFEASPLNMDAFLGTSEEIVGYLRSDEYGAVLDATRRLFFRVLRNGAPAPIGNPGGVLMGMISSWQSSG